MECGFARLRVRKINRLTSNFLANMKKFSLLLCSVLFSLLFYQCQEDIIDVNPVDSRSIQEGVITVEENITGDVTWTSGNTYLLNDMLSVTNNATLTIEPCVVIKAANGATGLIIDKGAKINAQGTAECPIIFTSAADELETGEIVSPNLTAEDVGLWSGIFILGEAPVSSSTPDNIVPLLPQQPLYSFGGATPDDDSGILSYVSIRHTGYETAPYETPSGLNLGGVGSSTSISHVELFANLDDGFLVVGGTVDVSNLITSHFKDDGIDCDRGYAGTMNNLIGIGGNLNNSSLELEGGEGQANPSFTIRNASFKGSQGGEDYIEFQRDVNCVIENTYFFGFDADAQVRLDRDSDADNWLAELIDVVNLEFNTAHLSAGNTTIEAIFVDAGDNGNDAFQIRTPDAGIVAAPTTGADKSVFEGWTVADLTGALNDF